MKADVIGLTEDMITPAAVDESSAKYVAERSILMVMRSGILRHSFPIAVTDRVVTVNQDLRALTPYEGIDPSFVARYLKFAARQILEECSKDGTTVNSVEVAALESVLVPIAPETEQERIANRIDRLFTQIADGERALDETRKGLQKFRCALLRAAVTGELTRDWRSANEIAETGRDRVARLRSLMAQSKRRRIPWRPRSVLPELPESWAWCAVDEAGEVQLGRQRAPQHHAGANMRPYLRVANVLEDRLDLTDVKQMNFTPEEFRTFALRPGDILLNEGQAPDLLGRPAMYRGEIEGCCFQKTLLRFRASELVDQDFALLVFRHYMHSGRFKRESRITTNIGHLTQVRFVEMEFPIPPPEEATEIIRRVSDGLAAADDVEAMLDAEAADAARLKQSILKAAFEGQLLPQNPADEPASALLARVSARQSSTTRKPRGRPGKSQ